MFCSDVRNVDVSFAVAKLVLVASDTWDGFCLEKKGSILRCGCCCSGAVVEVLAS